MRLIRSERGPENLRSKVEAESLARRIAEQTLGDMEKEKAMMETEYTGLLKRYTNDTSSKDNTIRMVSPPPPPLPGT